MDDHPTANAPQTSCRHCGASVAGLPHARDHDGYFCESCFLAARHHHALPAGYDNGQRALGEALVAALDAREHETGLHSKRVACHTLVLASHFSADPEELQHVYLGALLHDIGKIGIPDSILLKEGPLTGAEWRIMRGHPEIGYRILAGAPIMAEPARLGLNHEERYDGTGYPGGLAGEAIPLWARLFAVIDALDAITSDRPYRKGLPFDTARAEIARQSGTQFDPKAVDAFFAEEAALREMVEIKCATAAIPIAAPT